MRWRRVLVLVVLACCLAGACAGRPSSSTTSPSTTPTGSATRSPTASPARSLRAVPSISSTDGPITPTGYRESCAVQPQICRVRRGAVPRRLWRPLSFPVVRDGRCPVTHGRTLPDGLPFGGVALGGGPVRMVLGAGDAAASGVLPLTTARRQGWYAGSTLWYAEPSYRGPVLLRGTRLDRPGRVAFGFGRPAALAVQVPPGPGTAVVDGFRKWPGSTWVRQPGCYGIQADGTTFSTSVVVRARLR